MALDVPLLHFWCKDLCQLLPHVVENRLRTLLLLPQIQLPVWSSVGVPCLSIVFLILIAEEYDKAIEFVTSPFIAAMRKLLLIHCCASTL